LPQVQTILARLVSFFEEVLESATYMYDGSCRRSKTNEDRRLVVTDRVHGLIKRRARPQQQGAFEKSVEERFNETSNFFPIFDPEAVLRHFLILPL
jgi:hypothetical protein